MRKGPPQVLKAMVKTAIRFSAIRKLKRQIKFYETIQAGNILKIKENPGFNEGDAKALANVVQMVLREKTIIAEIGSWKGFSTSVLATSVADYHGSVFAIDHWMGSENNPHHKSTETIDIYSIFKRNMIALGVWDIVHPLVMDSHTACQIFADGILDLVFIDGDHRYESIKKDISSWLPKIRDGGILCGHDCEGYYEEYPEEIKRKIEEHLQDDVIPSGLCHPGVVKALYEYFGKNFSIMPNTTVWYYVKEKKI